MTYKSLISLLLSFILVACGDNSTQSETQIQETQSETQIQDMEDQQPQNNNNPFLDPNYSDCLKDKFGEERYKELQNQQPTP